MDKQTLGRILQENEEMCNDDKMLMDDIYEKILINKQIQKYIEKIDADVLEDQMMYGLLVKHSRKNLVDGLVSMAQVRFLIMVTEMSVRDKEDEFRILKNQLPEWMFTNVLYYFTCEDENDTNGYKGCFMLKDIVSVEPHQL